METTTSVADIHDQAGPVDTTAEFVQLQATMQEMFTKVAGHFELQPDPSVEDFHDYGVENGPSGSIRAYTGPEVDWMVNSWIGNPAMGFTNLHLTVWNGPHTYVPHLGLAFGTLPDYWYFVDYVPRVDLLARPDYLDRYYEPHNAGFMASRSEPGFSPFVSQTLYVRQAVSHTALCCVVKREPQFAQRMISLAWERVNDWLAHIAAGDPVPNDEREGLAARDLHVRRTVADRDPANIMGVRFFGEEMTDRLVRSLWGGDRAIARPHRR